MLKFAMLFVLSFGSVAAVANAAQPMEHEVFANAGALSVERLTAEQMQETDGEFFKKLVKLVHKEASQWWKDIKGWTRVEATLLVAEQTYNALKDDFIKTNREVVKIKTDAIMNASDTVFSHGKTGGGGGGGSASQNGSATPPAWPVPSTTIQVTNPPPIRTGRVTVIELPRNWQETGHSSYNSRSNYGYRGSYRSRSNYGYRSSFRRGRGGGSTCTHSYCNS